ncbi:amidohydrolase family protein [Franzmannia qiaohouensis]|uniref:Amidohydrolase family protein n=1 Tax=Franzmannia qiaohouensis TaxID=1329370 RepID=A0ABU1HI61_9GAMM|nr:amidohydrolase family protein [Halomonas qiaohouensis]MDR5906499.1 amidohydrolase family protein [Halomonas qiaohouensis]
MQSLPIIDAHQHFWDLERNYLPWLCDEPPIPFRYGDYSAIRRTYLPKDYRHDSRDYRIVGTVYVETEWDPRTPVDETRWVHALADREGLPTVMVAQARLNQPDVEEVLAQHSAFPRVRGIRHKPTSAPSPADIDPGIPGSMGDPAWRRGYAQLAKYGLSFDLQTPWWHFEEAAELAADFPETQIIINHTGLPADRSKEGLSGWRRAMQYVAAQPNVAIKISGIGLPGQAWTADVNRDVVLETIDIFGIDRCMFASNFPVDSLVAEFGTIFGGFMTITAELSDSDQRKLFHDNAVAFYRMPTDTGMAE